MLNANSRIVCVTNQPSPYRLHQFEHLNREFRRRSIDFSAIFMTKMESIRRWQFSPDEWSFQYRIASGIHPHWKGFALHFNPSILRDLCKSPPKWLLLGGGWSLPTVIYLAATSRFLLPNTKLLFWVEATVGYTAFTSSGIRRSIRQLILSLFDAFVIPSKSAGDYIYDLSRLRSKPLLWFNNVVDEDLYSTRVSGLRQQKKELRSRIGIDPDEIVLLWPARLSPEKGILQFLEAIIPLSASRFTILIAGDGPLRTEIECLIDKNRLVTVRLLGYQPLSQMLELYALADALLLASVREPFGFVAVEALWSALPLLVSQEIGALSEVLEPGVNGWVFDPSRPDSIQKTFKEVISTGQHNLSLMGMSSYQIANQKFLTRTSVTSFVDDLLRRFPIEE